MKKLFMIFWFVVLAVSVSAMQVSQYGVTWSFDKDYQTGRYVNGDYWVVGPVEVTIPQGSMINPVRLYSAKQGFYPAKKYYVPELDVGGTRIVLDGRLLSITRQIQKNA